MTEPGNLTAVPKMGASCWMRTWGNLVAPGWKMGEGHLPNPVVQGKQPGLILTLSLLQVYTKEKPAWSHKEQHAQHC